MNRLLICLICLFLPISAYASEYDFASGDTRVFINTINAPSVKDELLSIQVFQYELTDCDDFNVKCGHRIGFKATQLESQISDSFPSITVRDELGEDCLPFEPFTCVFSKMMYDTNQIIAINTKGLQEAFGEVSSLESRVDTLESAPAFDGSYLSLTNVPSTFTPSTHTHTVSQITDLTTATTSAGGLMSAADKLKLNGIATAATANDTDANLKARANHTGTQTASTISDFTASARGAISVTGNGSYNSGTGVITVAGGATCYNGNTTLSNCLSVAKSATVASGNAVFHLTSDGTSTGTALFPNGVALDSIQLRCNDEANAPCSFGAPVLSNSNKTVTVAVNKSTGLNVALLSLTLLGAPSAANGSVVKLHAFGN